MPAAVQHSAVVAKGRVIRPLKASRRYSTRPGFGVHREAQFLFASEVSFGGLNRNMPEEKLDLLQFAPAKMREYGARTPQTVRCQAFNICGLGCPFGCLANSVVRAFRSGSRTLEHLQTKNLSKNISG